MSSGHLARGKAGRTYLKGSSGAEMELETRLAAKSRRWPGASWCTLLLVALAVDLLTPFLIWKGVLPSFTRWMSHGAVAVAMVGAYVRMMVFDRVPRAVWLLGWLSATGIVVAVLRGQSIAATLWGWWVMFQFPLAALFVYLQWDWPKSVAKRLRLLCTAILAAEVVVQVAQYATGEPPGDHLAGTFGRYGVATLVLFTAFVLCLALGHWLADGGWKTLVLVLALGGVSSALGALKLFPFAALVLVMVALGMYGLRYGQPAKLAFCALLVVATVWVFFKLYDAVVPPVQGARPMEAYLDIDVLAEYLGGLEPASGTGDYSGRYFLGRNYAVSYGWNEIRRDATTFLFGMGLGARGESRTLGTAGVGLLQSRLGLTSGTTLLVMMQELGIVGMATLAGFALWTVATLFAEINRNPHSGATELRYALLLFTLLWPLWLWYTSVWLYRVPMLLYWGALGYVLAEPQLAKVAAEGVRVDGASLLRQQGNAL
jgi:hypothetical protein